MSNDILGAERRAIGAALADPVGADKVCDILGPDDFLDARNRLVFAAIQSLVRERRACSMSEVAALVARHDVTFADLEECHYGAHMVSGHAQADARIVLEASQLRRLAAVCTDIADMARKAAPIEGACSEVLEALREAADAIVARNPGRGPVALGGAEPELIQRILSDQPTPRGIPTGYIDLDEWLGGLRDGEMIVLAARPSVGKSLFACNIAENVAMAEDGRPVLVVSLEMSAASLYRRALFGRAGVRADHALAGLATDEEKDRLRTAHGELRRARIDVVADSTMTPQRVQAAARRFKARFGPCLVIVDYLGLMKGEGRTIYEQVTGLSKALKAIAVNLDVPMLVLSQLSRNAAETREANGATTVRVPSLSDLRDSGAIEQDADAVIFLARDISKRDPHDCIVKVAKNRPGRCGETSILFDTTGPRFRNRARVEHFNGKT